jgi:hypothetical protein
MRHRKDNYVQVVRFVRRLRGQSQSILVEGVNGLFYVLKFKNNPHGVSALFNEAAGSLLFESCRLAAPAWEPLLVSRGFIERNRECWIEGSDGLIRPEAGLCFGSRFLLTPRKQVFEILSKARYSHVRNRSSFWLAWVVDVICGHTDNRQALFVEGRNRKLDAIFIDSGNLFRGLDKPDRCRPLECRYLDSRIYAAMDLAQADAYLKTLSSLRFDLLLDRAQTLPSEWQTGPALSQFTKGLEALRDRTLVESTLVRLIRLQSNPQLEKPFSTPEIEGFRPSLFCL